AFRIFELKFTMMHQCSLECGCVERDEQKNITAESGQDVILTCRAANNNNIFVEWRRVDLDDYVLLYGDEGSVLEDQHPSFKNRVDLQDRQMKDGDVSLILKNVMIADSGTYECRVIQRGHSHKKTVIKNKPICIMDLKDGSIGWKVALSIFCLLLVAAVAVFMYRKC
uniref:Ig-like domain-containing protein n=1 Tax=Maylandia zebra TaxID=106582 RepID=A0A3P9D7D9_9CICH